MKKALLLASLFAATVQAQSPNFKEQQIDDAVGIGYGLAVADVNGDGRTDVLLADSNVIVWYENPTWKKHIIAEKLTEKDHVCIAARDINGDGKCEIAVGAEWNPGDTVGSGAVFYLIPPADRTQKWEPVKLTHEPTTHRMKWVRNRGGRYDLVVVPLHGRGNDKNAEGAGVRVLAYHMPDDPHKEWNTTLVQGTMHKTHNLDIIPAPASEAESLLLCGREGVVRLDQTDNGWKEQWIAQHPKDSADLQGAGEVRWGAFAGGQPYVTTIEPMHGDKLVIYTPPADGPKNGAWQRNVLSEQLVDGHAIATHDLLGLNNRQIVVGWRAQQKVGKVAVKLFWTTKEDGSGWKEAFIDDGGMACEDAVCADLDGDRDLEIIAAGRRSKNVKIYWNQRNQ
ncbi:FG-GAP repeat domain-containing protein [Prosthecobacter sp.]|uniref:FG-GAP repeat domain-containing protein n=1 Tax=Prosthecobacter sp. TaxID=1965333 RepID=UPI003782EF31